MSEEPKKAQPSPDDEKKKSDSWIKGGCLIVGIIFFITMFAFCSRMCSGSGYDDRWDRLDHSVKSDPYYKQW